MFVYSDRRPGKSAGCIHSEFSVQIIPTDDNFPQGVGNMAAS